MPKSSFRPRLESIDLLRGLVMAIMALDHARGFFTNAAFYPLEIEKTNLALFLTRWITHFCAPVFVFLAGTGAFLSGTRGRTKGDLCWFLLSRGLWLAFLEVTFIKCLGWEFGINYSTTGWGVLWAIGWSLVVLAGLVWTPTWFITAFGVGMIALHNAFDGVSPESLGAFGPLWRILHAGGFYDRGIGYMAGYPLIPWIGVLAAGYGFGQIFQWDAPRRRQWLLRCGVVLILLFFFARGTNSYGDPNPWKVWKDIHGVQGVNVLWTLLGWLHCQKYPPSLCYLLMTLGPAMIALSFFDRGTPALLRPLLVFGKVPLFYYLLHLPLIHGMSVVVNFIRFGRSDWQYGWPFPKGSEPKPEAAGFDLPGVYIAWICALLILYPVCRWFAGVKQRRKDEWLSYL